MFCGASIFTMDRRLPIALLVAITAPGSMVQAGQPYIGPYAGGDVLLERMQVDAADAHEVLARSHRHDREERDLGWKGLVGVRMSRHLAFEAGFTDFGEFTALPATHSDGPSRARVRAFTACAVGILPVGPVEAFVKAGPTRLQSTGHLGGAYFDEQQRRISGGAGMQWTRGRMVLRLEYEKFGSARVGDLDSIALGLRLSLNPG